MFISHLPPVTMNGVQEVFSSVRHIFRAMTADWQTIGHDKAVATLTRSMESGRMAHAWLLAGPPHVGKMTLALDLARLINCTAGDPKGRPCGDCRQCRRIANSLHADVRVISQGGTAGSTSRRTAISVEQIRELQREAALKPYEGRYRVFIIEDAENFTQEAANALLKMLEEPPEDVIFALLASEVRENTQDESAAGYITYSPEHEQNRIAALLEAVPQVGGILPTILSRCQALQLRPLPVTTVQSELEGRFNLKPEVATEIARLSGGRLGWALQAAAEPRLLTRRSERLDEIEAVLSGGLDEKFAYAERQASAFSRSREVVYEEMRLWLSWWRDVLVIREGNHDLVLNLSRSSALRAAASACTSAQVVSTIRAIQETTAMLESNVNARLCIEDMMLRMPQLPEQTPTA